ncbi:MAG: Wzz/FepE/Etk N-terminal domain-containing protein [Armatimonadota bacterium]|nr:Wzz/FepE/Etk N-terminal domain-containing protein [Armatimonadota bacterium]
MEDEIDLREYFAVLGRRKWTIIAVFLVAVLAAAVLSFFVLPPIYEASLLLQPAKGSGDVYADPNGLTAVLESEGFTSRAVSGLGLNPQILTVKASVVRNTQLVRLSVRAKDPHQARRAVEALANLAGKESRPSIEKKRQVLRRQLGELSQLLQTTARTRADLRGIVEPLLRQARPTVEDVITKSYAANVLGTTDAFYNALLSAQVNLNLQMIDLQPVQVLGAQRAVQLVAPRKTLNIALAAVLGLMAGVMLAFFQEFLAAPRPEAVSTPAGGAGHAPVPSRLPGDPRS